jgi:hypothetical protein
VIKSRRIRWGERERESYSKYVEKRGSYRVLVEKHERKSNSEDLEVDGRVTR